MAGTRALVGSYSRDNRACVRSQTSELKRALLPPGIQRELGPSIGYAEPELPVFFIAGRVGHSPSFRGLFTQFFAIQFHGEIAYLTPSR